jgi:hypothetical protein
VHALQSTAMGKWQSIGIELTLWYVGIGNTDYSISLTFVLLLLHCTIPQFTIRTRKSTCCFGRGVHGENGYVDVDVDVCV